MSRYPIRQPMTRRPAPEAEVGAEARMRAILAKRTASGSSNGRTSGFGPDNAGSTPAPESNSRCMEPIQPSLINGSGTGRDNLSAQVITSPSPVSAAALCWNCDEPCVGSDGPYRWVSTNGKFVIRRHVIVDAIHKQPCIQQWSIYSQQEYGEAYRASLFSLEEAKQWCEERA